MSITIPCSECEESESTKYCHSCSLAYCNECATQRHSKGKRKQHKIANIKNPQSNRNASSSSSSITNTLISLESSTPFDLSDPSDLGFTFVDASSLEEQFSCSICLEVLVDPVTVLPCMHGFCSTCISQLQTNKCPECRGTIEDVKRDFRLSGFLEKQLVLCGFHQEKEGCEWIGPFSQLKTHLESLCRFSELKCKHWKRGCPRTGNRADLTEHIQNCQYADVECQQCQQWKGSREDFMMHMNECPDVEVQCPRGCDTMVLRRNLDDHENVCPLVVKMCDHSQLGCHFFGDLECRTEHLRTCPYHGLPKVIVQKLMRLQAFEEQKQFRDRFQEDVESELHELRQETALKDDTIERMHELLLERTKEIERLTKTLTEAQEVIRVVEQRKQVHQSKTWRMMYEAGELALEQETEPFLEQNVWGGFELEDDESTPVNNNTTTTTTNTNPFEWNPERPLEYNSQSSLSGTSNSSLREQRREQRERRNRRAWDAQRLPKPQNKNNPFSFEAQTQEQDDDLVSNSQIDVEEDEKNIQRIFYEKNLWDEWE